MLGNVSYSAIDRRSFIAGAGSLFFSTLSAKSADTIDKTDLLFASCTKDCDGKFGAVIVNENAELISRISLPDRGHAVVVDQSSNRAIAFARRPGNFAVVFNADGSSPPQTVTAPEGRHFYGHGVFSPTGDLLYASENDFGNAEGKIGIYDVENSFKRLGEFESYGVGPHEILLLPDGKTLAIANGGIETHPEYGRAKLNLSTMEPSLVFINSHTGDLIEKHTLKLNRLSIRHLAATPTGGIIFGCQFQGAKSDTPPLIGRCDLGVGIHLWPHEEDRLLANYTGSVSLSMDGNHVAVSSPKGGVIMIFDVHTGNWTKTYKLPGGAGIAAKGDGFIASSDQGALKQIGDTGPTTQMPFLFDNHLTQVVR